MKSVVDFRARAEELKMLAYVHPRPQDRNIVMESLYCKWEGLQSLAAQTLGRWGDRESVEALRAFYFKSHADKKSWPFMWIIARALAVCAKEHDADWVLDLYFDLKGFEQEVFAGVVNALVVEKVRQRLLEESRSPDRKRRLATLHVLGRMAFADRLALLKRFLDDEDGEIASIARLLNHPFLPGEKDDS